MASISIDPGVNACGVAVWESVSNGNTLIYARLIKSQSAGAKAMVESVANNLDLRTYDVLAIELPQIYVRSRSKGDPNDLIQLALVVGAFVQRFTGTVVMYKPHEWKGTVPKKIMIERILKRLSNDEKSRIQKAPNSLLHNTVDAIGIGLYHTKRL